MASENNMVAVPCGGCGATTSAQRCIGCLHDFGTPESAWVRDLSARLASPQPDAQQGEATLSVSETVAPSSPALDAATIERFREAIVTIIGRCEALEDEAAEELVKAPPEHAAGFYRGQKSTAKSLRNHLADLARPFALPNAEKRHG